MRDLIALLDGHAIAGLGQHAEVSWLPQNIPMVLLNSMMPPACSAAKPYPHQTSIRSFLREQYYIFSA